MCAPNMVKIGWFLTEMLKKQKVDVFIGTRCSCGVVVDLLISWRLNGLHTRGVCSADARAGVRKRDGDHTTHVRATRHLPEQDERTQRLLPHASHSATTQAAHAGVLPDHVVAQQRHRRTRGNSMNVYVTARCPSASVRLSVCPVDR